MIFFETTTRPCNICTYVHTAATVRLATHLARCGSCTLNRKNAERWIMGCWTTSLDRRKNWRLYTKPRLHPYAALQRVPAINHSGIDARESIGLP